jgi:hypothetical protein
LVRVQAPSRFRWLGGVSYADIPFGHVRFIGGFEVGTWHVVRFKWVPGILVTCSGAFTEPIIHDVELEKVGRIRVEIDFGAIDMNGLTGLVHLRTFTLVFVA